MRKCLPKLLLPIIGMLIGTNAHAYDFEVNGIYYYTNDDNSTVSVTANPSGNNYSGNIDIPATVTYNGTTYTVTVIDGYAFIGCDNLTAITIPEGVTTIESSAFEGCTGLASVNFKAVSCADFEYSTNPFFYCPIESVTFGENVKRIPAYLLDNCRMLTSVTIPNTVTSIGLRAFGNCRSLMSIEVPNSVVEIEKFAFSGCSGLKSVAIGNSVKTIGIGAFNSCSNLSVHISDIAKWCEISFGDNGSNPLSCAENLYLNGELMTNLVIPDGVTSIGDYAFYNCVSLTSVDIPNSVSKIGNSAFKNCSGMANVYITDIAKWCEIGFGDKYSNPLYYNNGRLFLNKKRVRALEIPDGVTKISDYAFYYCSGLTSLTIPNSVTTIGNYAFDGCSGLTSAIIGEAVTEIGNVAFGSCSGLTSVAIPNSVTKIGDEAFIGCEGLTSVHISDIAKWCEISFGDWSTNPLYYAENLYLNGELVTDLVIPEGVSLIGDYAFQGCNSLTSVTISNSVNSIGNSAFEYCSDLTSVTIPNSVTLIGNGAFESCDGLTSVTIPNSVTLIGNSAFECCGLKSVKIGDSVTEIGDEAFMGCWLLTSVTIGEKVEKIGKSAFSSCTNLMEINSCNPTPPLIESDTFAGVDKNNCVLNVPLECETEYGVAYYWDEFLNINEKDFSGQSGVDDIVKSGVVEVSRCTVDGCMIDEPRRGVNIVRYSDGSVHKVLVK